MNITPKAAFSRTMLDLDARINEELESLNYRLSLMEKCLIDLSPVRLEVSVPCKVGNTSNPDRIDLPSDSIVFACRKSRWGMYYRFATGNGDQFELRDISQMSVAQRIQAVEAFEPLVEAMIESRLARFRSIQSANAAASDAIQRLAKVPE